MEVLLHYLVAFFAERPDLIGGAGDTGRASGPAVLWLSWFTIAVKSEDGAEAAFWSRSSQSELIGEGVDTHHIETIVCIAHGIRGVLGYHPGSHLALMVSKWYSYDGDADGSVTYQYP